MLFRKKLLLLKSHEGSEDISRTIWLIYSQGFLLNSCEHIETKLVNKYFLKCCIDYDSINRSFARSISNYLFYVLESLITRYLIEITLSLTDCRKQKNNKTLTQFKKTSFFLLPFYLFDRSSNNRKSLKINWYLKIQIAEIFFYRK